MRSMFRIFVGLGLLLSVGKTKEVDDLPRSGEDYRITDLALELVWVNAGTFVMGSPITEAGRNQAEGPQTQVTLSQGFWLGQTEVTQAQYEALTGKNPSAFAAVGPNGPVDHVSGGAKTAASVGVL